MGEGNTSPNLYKTIMEKYVHIELRGSDNSDTNISAFDVKIIDGLGTNVPDFVNAKKYVPKQGDMIYLLPGVNIPRVKLKDLALNLGIRVVRDPEKANVIFSGKSSMGKMTASSWYYIADAEVILNNVKEICKDEYYIEKLETALVASGATKICSDWSDMRNCLARNETKHYDNGYIYAIEEEYTEAYNGMQGKPVYDESELITNINGDDSTIIDEEVYQQLGSMFESSDSDNHILAMEIMANSHYEKSILYLQMLLSNYYYQISNSHTRNHVNFKSMLSYFNWATRSLGSSAEQIVSIIDEKGLLTVDMIKRLYKEYTRSVHGNINYSDVFEVKEFTIKQAYLDKLNLSSLNLINPEPAENLEVTEPEDEIITDELLEAALSSINRKELKSELIAIEEELIISESELNKTEEESNNNQIKENNEGNDLDWF